jgi:diguanylate cyclase (GGDEF)-like protein
MSNSSKWILIILGLFLVLTFILGLHQILWLLLPAFFAFGLNLVFPDWAGYFTAGCVVELLLEMLVKHQWPMDLWIEMLVLIGLFFLADFMVQEKKNRQFVWDSQKMELTTEYQKLQDQFLSITQSNSQLENQVKETEQIYDIMKEAASTMTVSEMLQLMINYLKRMFDLPHFVVLLLSDDSKKYEIRYSRGCEESLMRSIKVEMTPDLFFTVLIAERLPRFVADVKKEPMFAGLSKIAIKSFLFLPFITQTQVIGFLCSFSSDDTWTIDQTTFERLRAFSNQLSIGLQKSLLYEKILKLSITDGLTKLFSHRYFQQRLEEECILAKRYSLNLTLLILDIDYFKHYNDTYGHVAGDSVLMDVSRILKQQSENTQIVARYGGEEMVVLAPETPKESGRILAEKIREAIEKNKFSVGEISTTVTVSIGVATLPEDARDPEELIAKADEALYRAKNLGRNRVIVY